MEYPTDKIKNLMQSASKWCLAHIKGLGALIGGIFLMYYFMNVIVYFAMFALGAFLTYYGFAELNVTGVTNFVDKILKKIKIFSFKQ